MMRWWSCTVGLNVHLSTPRRSNSSSEMTCECFVWIWQYDSAGTFYVTDTAVFFVYVNHRTSVAVLPLNSSACSAAANTANMLCRTFRELQSYSCALGLINWKLKVARKFQTRHRFAQNSPESGKGGCTIPVVPRHQISCYENTHFPLFAFISTFQWPSEHLQFWAALSVWTNLFHSCFAVEN